MHRLRGPPADAERRNGTAGRGGEPGGCGGLGPRAVCEAPPPGAGLPPTAGAAAGAPPLHGDGRRRRLHSQRHQLHPRREELLHHHR